MCNQEFHADVETKILELPYLPQIIENLQTLKRDEENGFAENQSLSDEIQIQTEIESADVVLPQQTNLESETAPEYPTKTKSKRARKREAQNQRAKQSKVAQNQFSNGNPTIPARSMKGD